MGKKRRSGEFEMIRSLRERVEKSRKVSLGIGDDAALLDLKRDRGTLVTTDALVEKIHFPSQGLSPYRIGWKALAANCSDIAAMSGRPTQAVVTLALPRKGGRLFFQGFWRGWNALARHIHRTYINGE